MALTSTSFSTSWAAALAGVIVSLRCLSDTHLPVRTSVVALNQNVTVATYRRGILSCDRPLSDHVFLPDTNVCTAQSAMDDLRTGRPVFLGQALFPDRFPSERRRPCGWNGTARISGAEVPGAPRSPLKVAAARRDRPVDGAAENGVPGRTRRAAAGRQPDAPTVRRRAPGDPPGRCAGDGPSSAVDQAGADATAWCREEYPCATRPCDRRPRCRYLPSTSTRACLPAAATARGDPRPATAALSPAGSELSRRAA